MNLCDELHGLILAARYLGHRLELILESGDEYGDGENG